MLAPVRLILAEYYYKVLFVQVELQISRRYASVSLVKNDEYVTMHKLHITPMRHV